jgi:enoyl-CoA hydratase/carnithine racemase
MGYECLKYEKEDGFAVITLNRPKALNAMNWQLEKEIDDALDEVRLDDDVKVFIFTGAPREDGRPCFSAGGDLKEYATHKMYKGGAEDLRGESFPVSSPALALWSYRKWRLSIHGNKMPNIYWSPKISIAAVDGVCTAGGIELACSCDIILASETAQLSEMHVKTLGQIGGSAAATLLAWRIGVSRALQMCLTGEPIDGKNAYRIGLANEVYAPDKLLDGAKTLARKIAAMRTVAVTMTKATCNSIRDMGFNEAWAYSDACLYAIEAAPDTPEWGAGHWVNRPKE